MKKNTHLNLAPAPATLALAALMLAGRSSYKNTVKSSAVQYVDTDPLIKVPQR